MKKDNKIRLSIKNKILILLSLAAVPFLVMVVYLLLSMANYSKAYDNIVRNLTIANNYNLNFKEEVDESLYKLVVGYVTIENIAQDDTLTDPYILIDELRSEFTKLKDVTTETESKLWLESLLRNIDTLEKRVNDIIDNLAEGEHYNENINQLDNNIYILTELIQDDIQYYIYYQTRSMEEVTNDLNRQMKEFIIICGVLVIVLVIAVTSATVLIASGILRPIRELYQVTGKISEGNFEVRASANSRDELEVLAHGFNHMADNIQSLIDKIKKDEQKMRSADLRLLQEQINPHFLYNTLDTIVWLVEANEPDQAVEMIVTLSDFFRLVLSKGKEFISIEQEEQHIRSYLQIQEMRYQDILAYDIRINPDLYDYQILKLTLQPLVENALYHGIKCKRAKGTISITGEKQGAVICFQVKDDGVGMDEEELQQLRKEIVRPCQETEKGFGLANVNERIRMHFGEQYGMTIDAVKGEYTAVKVMIPAVKLDRRREQGG